MIHVTMAQVPWFIHERSSWRSMHAHVTDCPAHRSCSPAAVQGDVYCHRRTSTKRVFPSLYDMFIGGVSESMEPAAHTALRELGEELDLGPLAAGGHETKAGEQAAESHDRDAVVMVRLHPVMK